MIFNIDAVTDLKTFHQQLKPDEEWDMNVDTLLMVGCVKIIEPS